MSHALLTAISVYDDVRSLIQSKFGNLDIIIRRPCRHYNCGYLYVIGEDSINNTPRQTTF